MSFALAIRNTVSEARQAMLTTTSLIVIATVVLQGGAASHALAYLRIPTGYVWRRKISLKGNLTDANLDYFIILTRIFVQKHTHFLRGFVATFVHSALDWICVRIA